MAIIFDGLISHTFDELYANRTNNAIIYVPEVKLANRVSPELYGFIDKNPITMSETKIISGTIDKESPIYLNRIINIYQGFEYDNKLKTLGQKKIPTALIFDTEIDMGNLLECDFFSIANLSSGFYLNVNNVWDKFNDYNVGNTLGLKQSIVTPEKDIFGIRVLESKSGLNIYPKDSIVSKDRLPKAVSMLHDRLIGSSTREYGSIQDDIIIGLRKFFIHIGFFNDPFDEWNAFPSVYIGNIREKYIVSDSRVPRQGIIPYEDITIETIEFLSTRILPVDFWKEELSLQEYNIHKGYIHGVVIARQEEYPDIRIIPTSYLYDY